MSKSGEHNGKEADRQKNGKGGKRDDLGEWGIDHDAPANDPPRSTEGENSQSMDGALQETEVVLRVPVHLTEFKTPSYVNDRVQVTGLRPKAAEALRRLFETLRARHAQLADGNHVDKDHHAVKWLLERIGDGIERERSQRRGRIVR